MKLTVAATIISSSALARAEPLTNLAGESLQNAVAFSSHRSLASEDQHDIAAIFKERRASKRQNGKIFRKLKNKLKDLKLRNEGQEDGDVTDADLDLGFFSRSLQSNMTEPEESSVIYELLDMCAGDEEVEGFFCTCSDIDVDAYTANVLCTYDSNCLNPTPNSCGETATFCFVETYNLEVTAPGQGSSSICYEVISPTEFSYCYGLTYLEDPESPDSCFLSVDGTQCNSCEFAVLPNDPNTTCSRFDCTNADDAIASGIACGDETIVSLKIEDYLIYGPLPCEGGCNICPEDGEMMNLYNDVTMITGETYSCTQLNLAALMGYLQDVPGDLCNVLPGIVAGPCECSGTTTETPTPTIGDETPTDPEPIEDITDITKATSESDPDVTEEVVDETVDETIEGDTSGSAALSHGLDKFTFAAAMAAIFWKMIE